MVTLLNRLLRSVAVLLSVTFATFTLMYGNAEGIAHAVLGLRATAEDVKNEVIRLGLDQPLHLQYWNWITNALHGDLGVSYYTSESVWEALSTRVPVTLTVVFVVLFLTAVLSVLLGIGAALRGGRSDSMIQITSVLGTAVPSFVVAIGLVFTFAINWRLLPATGYVSPGESVSGWLNSLVLPTAALLIGSVASATQQFRSAVLDTLGRDYVRTLRARGMSEKAVILRHVLRNAAAPGLTVLSLTTFGLLGGAVFIEQVFALPGMGQMANASAQISDVPMVMGAVLVTIVIVLVVNLLGDLAIGLLNPKSGERKSK